MINYAHTIATFAAPQCRPQPPPLRARAPPGVHQRRPGGAAAAKRRGRHGCRYDSSVPSNARYKHVCRVLPQDSPLLYVWVLQPECGAAGSSVAVRSHSSAYQC